VTSVLLSNRAALAGKTGLQQFDHRLREWARGATTLAKVR
jgi:hypothetical protein